MPNKGIFKIILITLFVSFAIVATAQKSGTSAKNYSGNWQINYNLGFTQFYGDASNNGYFKKFSGEISFATGITIRKYTSPVIAWGVNLLYSGIKSHKDKSATGGVVNFGLSGKYFDANVNMLVDFTNLFWGHNSHKLTVYGTIGLGFATWNNQLTDSINGIIINSGDVIGDITYKKGGAVVPIGLGLNYMINSNWAINFEMNLRTVLNDDVDVWRDGFKYDQPFYTGFGISYFLNQNNNTPKPRTVKNHSTLNRKEPLKPGVPLYDYRLQPKNKKSGGADLDVILIEAPVEKVMPVITGVIYRVQILAKRDKLKNISSLKSRFNIANDIYENYQDGVYRYSTGTFATYSEAMQQSKWLKEKGVHDAFVVAYKNNRRVNITSEMKSF
jgi:outer membrane protein with beta-barrel domain